MQNVESKYLDELQEDMKRQRALALDRLEALGNLPEMVEALRRSESFKPLGYALSPLVKYEDPEKRKVKPRQKSKLETWLKSKQIKPIDAFACAMVSTLFAGFGWGIVNAFGFGWSVLVGLSVLGIIYVVALNLVAGGILD